LELGCAAGQLAAAVRSAHPDAAYTGIELSPAGRRAAGIVDRLSDRPLDDLVRDGVLASASVDVVVSSHVLEHIPDVHATMSAIGHVLAPGGALFLEVPNGSGHPALPFDENPSHLHFFTVSSLSRLLAAHGFQISRAQTGAFHDERYPDSLRILARPRAAPRMTHAFSAALRKLGLPRVAVWGAGKLAEELLNGALAPADIAFFVDRDPSKQGQQMMGREIRALDALHGAPDLAILISSLDFEAEIAAQIARDFGSPPRRVISIREVLDLAAQQS
jgi:SAM-dependent methyltransferase